MPSFNFSVFVDKVENGTKPCTIRAARKYPVKVGDDLSFFTGMRTTACRRLRPNTPCTKVTPITILTRGPSATVKLGGRYLKATELDALVKRDGFDSQHAFVAFFTEKYGARFDGNLIEWQP